jgi:uncharacterized membrane protein YfcA
MNGLTGKERDFLDKFMRYSEKSHYDYIAVGLLGCLSILGIVLGIKFGSRDGFMMALYFGTLAVIIAIKNGRDRKLTRILGKMRQNRSNQATNT